MATQASTKVRLVRCPGCLKVLAELPGVSLYKCGGCGTILQAKNRKMETNNAELSSQETNSVAQDLGDDVIGQEGARMSNQDVSGSFKGEPSPVKSVLSESSLVKVKESPEFNSLGQTPEGCRSKLDEDSAELSVGHTSSDDLPSLGEITLDDEADEHMEQHNQVDLHQDVVDHKEDEVQNFLEHEDQESVLQEKIIKDSNVDLHQDVVDHKEDEVQNFLEHEDQESVLQEKIIKDSNVPPRNDENEEFDGGIERNVLVHKNDVMSPSRREKNASLVSFYLTSDDENLDHSQSEVTRNFGRVSSIDTLGSSNLDYVSADLNFEHGSMTDYTRNGSYYAYDGSESSYDGTDYQIFKHTSHPSRKNNVLRKDGFHGDNVMISEPERTYWGTSTPHRAMRRSHWSRGTAIEANRYNSGYRMGVDKQGDVSGLPSALREPVASHRTARTSGYRHSLLPPRPGVSLQNKPPYVESDKLDLLRTVCELKDQLNRMNFSPFRYNHLVPNSDLYRNDPNRYNPQHYHAEGCAKRCNASRLAFSGEAAHYRHHVRCSCLHCSPQDWHYSEQLPPRNCCNVSSSPSPRHYTSSELSLLGCETKPDNQRLDERKRLLSAKRHLRPIAGGAPVVACYHCLELLQLPADFLLFKRRYHRLMCSACKKVLKFSVLRGTHIVPYVNDASAPPPSEADAHNDSATRQRNLKPVSYSDDYGQSFCRSCSTEGEASDVLPSFNRVEKNSYYRKISSGSSCGPAEDRKMKGVIKEPQSENEDSPNSVDSVGPRNFTTEIEEVMPLSNSPLHLLMGYTSASQVLDR